MSIPLNITIPGKQAQAFKDRIKEEAVRQGISVSEYVVEAIAEYLRNHQNEPQS